VIQQTNGHDTNVDWWGVGVLMIELLSGEMPFSNEEDEVISERIQEEAPNIPATVSFSIAQN
jgi:serine/threonine protein kinase